MLFPALAAKNQEAGSSTPLRFAQNDSGEGAHPTLAYPPPLFCGQHPCFFNLMAWLRCKILKKNEDACKIFQGKEFGGTFFLCRPLPAGKRHEDYWDHSATKRGNNLRPPAVGPAARYSLARGSWCSESQNTRVLEHPPVHRDTCFGALISGPKGPKIWPIFQEAEAPCSLRNRRATTVVLR